MNVNLDSSTEGWVKVALSPLSIGVVYLEVYREEAGWAEERIAFPFTLRLTGTPSGDLFQAYLRVAVLSYDCESKTLDIEINGTDYTVSNENVVGLEP